MIPRLHKLALIYNELVPRCLGSTVRAKSPCGGSALMTSAPSSAKNSPVTGPTPMPEISSTRSPAKGPPVWCTRGGATGASASEGLGRG